MTNQNLSYLRQMQEILLENPQDTQQTACLQCEAHFFSEEEGKLLFDTLTKEIAWQEKKIKLFGKEVMQPRLVAWYGDEGIAYTYSGVTQYALPWTEALQTTRTKVQTITGQSFNSVLLNLYRDGQDSMGWHSDNERELGKNPIIASISLGENRKFRFRNKTNRDIRYSFDLGGNSLLLMGENTQTYWQHALPKTQYAEARINLTFRKIFAG